VTTTALGIDIGGTAIKMGIVARGGSIMARDTFPFDHDLSFDGVVAQIAERAAALSEHALARPAAIGIAAPGFADPQTGVFVDGTNNVPVLRGRALALALSEHLDLPAVIENDALAAARCELCFGAGRGRSRFVLLTIGTGVGGAVMVDGRVLRGPDGRPPEFGALVLDRSGELNYSGLRGTLEFLANAEAFARSYRRAGGAADATAAAVFDRARRGDSHAVTAVDETTRWIAQALGTMINILAPEACIIGGGVAAAGSALLDPIRRQLSDFTWPTLLSRTDLVLAELGNDAGLIGAASLAFEALSA
jgi:glucokinase